MVKVDLKHRSCRYLLRNAPTLYLLPGVRTLILLPAPPPSNILTLESAAALLPKPASDGNIRLQCRVSFFFSCASETFQPLPRQIPRIKSMLHIYLGEGRRGGVAAGGKRSPSGPRLLPCGCGGRRQRQADQLFPLVVTVVNLPLQTPARWRKIKTDPKHLQEDKSSCVSGN